jgi:hypothetical protein
MVSDAVVGPRDGNDPNMAGGETSYQVAEPLNGRSVDIADPFAIHDEPLLVSGVVS